MAKVIVKWSSHDQEIFLPLHEQANIDVSLGELENKLVLWFITTNCPLVSVSMMIILSQEDIHLQWLLEVKENITMNEETQKVSIF